MADFERILAAMGAVPKGATPKTIVEEGGEPGYYGTDTLSNLVRVLKKNKLEIEEKIKKQQESAKTDADFYKTLRDAGYDPQSAYDAVTKRKLTPPGPEDFSLKKTIRERILDKIARNQPLTPGEQKVYDDTIKHKTEDENLLDEAIKNKEVPEQTPSQKKMSEKILDKMANGEKLTSGEQKIYDEVIKKMQPAKKEDLTDVLQNKDLVAVYKPDGTPGFIPKANLEKALKAGWKKR